jgi:hypothetical protein
MNTPVTICNTALSRIGISSFISSLEESSIEARVCENVYEQSVYHLLREFHWPFAQSYEQLALVADGTATPWKTDWAYRYRYPSNAITVRRIVTQLGKQEYQAAAYSIGRDSVGKLIYTDIEDAVAEITNRHIDASEFDPTFASALAWYIAAEICMPLSVSDSFRKQALQGFLLDLDKAKQIAANESQPSRDVDTELMNSRFGPIAGGINDLTIYPSGFKVG